MLRLHCNLQRASMGAHVNPDNCSPLPTFLPGLRNMQLQSGQFLFQILGKIWLPQSVGSIISLCKVRGQEVRPIGMKAEY